MSRRHHDYSHRSNRNIRPGLCPQPALGLSRPDRRFVVLGCHYWHRGRTEQAQEMNRPKAKWDLLACSIFFIFMVIFVGAAIAVGYLLAWIFP